MSNENSKKVALHDLLYSVDGMACEYREENYGNAREWLRHIERSYRAYQAVEDGDLPEYTIEMSEDNILPPIGCSAYCCYTGEVHKIIAHDLTDYPNVAITLSNMGYFGADGKHWLTVEEGEEINA